VSDLIAIQEAMTADKFRTFANDYMSIIRENWRDADRAYRRALLLLLISAVLFELLRTARVSPRLDLGFVEVTDLRAALIAIPVAVSYFFYEAGALNSLTSRYYHYHRSVFLEVQKQTPNRHRLSEAMLPATITLSLDDWWISSLVGTKTFGDLILGVVTWPLILVQIIGPPLFLAYAFWRLFSAYGAGEIFIWCSLILTLGYVIAAYVVIFSSDHVKDIEE
jgi:hypothetical protein